MRYVRPFYDSQLTSYVNIDGAAAGGCMMFVSGVENEDLYHADTVVKLAEALLRLTGTVSSAAGQGQSQGLHSLQAPARQPAAAPSFVCCDQPAKLRFNVSAPVWMLPISLVTPCW